MHHRIQLTTPDGKPLKLPSDNWHKLIRSKDAKLIPGFVHIRLSVAPQGLYVPSRPTPLLSHLHSPAALYAHDSIARQWMYPNLNTEYVGYLMSHVRACDNNRGTLLLTLDRIIFIGDSAGHVYGCPFAAPSLSNLVVSLPVCSVKTVSVVADKRAEMNWTISITTNDFRHLQVYVEPGTRMTSTWTRAGHDSKELQEVQAKDSSRFLTNLMNEIYWRKAEKTAMVPTELDSPWQRPVPSGSAQSVRGLEGRPNHTATNSLDRDSSTEPLPSSSPARPRDLRESFPPPAFEEVDAPPVPPRRPPSPPAFVEAMPELSSPSDATDIELQSVSEPGALSPTDSTEPFPETFDSPRTTSSAISAPAKVGATLQRASSWSTVQSEDTAAMDVSTSSLLLESYTFDIEKEFQRVVGNIQGDVVAREWMIFNHTDYNVCPTYPQHLLMPKRFFDWPKQPLGRLCARLILSL